MRNERRKHQIKFSALFLFIFFFRSFFFRCDCCFQCDCARASAENRVSFVFVDRVIVCEERTEPKKERGEKNNRKMRKPNPIHNNRARKRNEREKRLPTEHKSRYCWTMHSRTQTHTQVGRPMLKVSIAEVRVQSREMLPNAETKTIITTTGLRLSTEVLSARSLFADEILISASHCPVLRGLTFKFVLSPHVRVRAEKGISFRRKSITEKNRLFSSFRFFFSFFFFAMRVDAECIFSISFSDDGISVVFLLFFVWVENECTRAYGDLSCAKSE